MEKDLLTLSAWKPDVNAGKIHLEDSARPQIEDILALEFCSACDTQSHHQTKTRRGKWLVRICHLLRHPRLFLPRSPWCHLYRQRRHLALPGDRQRPGAWACSEEPSWEIVHRDI